MVESQKNSTPNDIPVHIPARKIDQIVKLTAIINHRLVFVRPAKDKDDVAFAQLLCDTVKYARDAKFLNGLPSIGSLVLAKFGYYQRALVLKHVDATKVAVAFIDFGNIEICDFSELKVMAEQLKQIDRFARKIELSQIENGIMNNQALEVLYRYLANEAELKIEFGPHSEETNTVTASLKSSDKWINQLVNQMNVNGIQVQRTKSVTERVCWR